MNPSLDNPKRIDAMDAMEGGKLFPIKHGMSVGMLPNISLSTESENDTTRSLGRRKSAPSTKYHDSNWSSISGSSSNCFDGAGNNNKFSVFSKLEKTNGGKGWGRKVLGSSPMGWSDEILGSSVDSDDESELAQASRPNTLKVEEEPWHSGAALVGRKTWEKSPSRSFVRNFP